MTEHEAFQILSDLAWSTNGNKRVEVRSFAKAAQVLLSHYVDCTEALRVERYTARVVEQVKEELRGVMDDHLAVAEALRSQALHQDLGTRHVDPSELVLILGSLQRFHQAKELLEIVTERFS